MSSGWFWRSPSIVTTISPRARERPACMAGCWPKLRLKRTAWTRGSAACSRSTAANVPSRRAVVDEDQLERLPVERRYGAPVELLDRAFLVQERHDDGEEGRIGHERQGAYRRSLARRASRPGVAGAGLPRRRGLRGDDRALDARRCRPAKVPDDGGAPHPRRRLGARGHGAEPRRGSASARPGRAHSIYLFWDEDWASRPLVRQLRAAADAGRPSASTLSTRSST